MEIGQLNKRIELVNTIYVAQDEGSKERADSVEATVWGNVRQASWGSKQRHGLQNEQEVQVVITIRWRADLARGFGKEARARYKDKGGQIREVTIKSVIDPNDRAQWLELAGSEGGAK